jgi:hypothetical protein
MMRSLSLTLKSALFPSTMSVNLVIGSQGNNMQVQASNNEFNMSWIKPVHEGSEPGVSASEAVVSELGYAFAAAVRKTLHTCQADQSAAINARADMVSGTLETPEAFREAAENLLACGI